MEKVERLPPGVFRPGDVFLLAGRSLCGRLVNFVQSLFAKTRTSKYNHAAVITSSDGDIFESAKRTIKFTSLKTRYRRSEVLIIRWRQMNRERFLQGMAEIIHLEGRLYPFWRQLLHLLRLGRLSFGHDCVCSELVARFLTGAGARPAPWAGVNVEDLREELLGNPAQYQVVFQGPMHTFFRAGP